MAEKDDDAAGYVVTKKGDGVFEVLKVDLAADKITGRYTVRDSICTCKGFEYRKTCRHIGMVYDRPKPCPRGEARKTAASTLHAFEDVFDSMEFVEYVFVDPDEELVKEIVFQAHGKRPVIDGIPLERLVGVRDNVQVRIEIDGRKK